MKKGYVYAMMAAVAAMTVSGCSSSSSAPASTAAESKTENRNGLRSRKNGCEETGRSHAGLPVPVN